MAQAPERRVRQPGHLVRTEPSPRWVRGVANGVVVVDSKRAILLYETGALPAYYFPMDDVRMELFEPTDRVTHCPYKGAATYWTLNVGDKVEENAIWSYPEPLDEESPDLRGYVAFYWNKIDAWFEESEQIFAHARDPYHRVDVVTSSRHVKVVLDGETVAETHNPTLLFETSLPVRYYIPMMDVRLDLLRPSERITLCPYKGRATYYSVQTAQQLHDDMVWYYRYPTPEASATKGLLCFFNERADLFVDGEQLERPQTSWSR